MAFTRFPYICIGKSNSSHYIKTNINLLLKYIVKLKLNADYNILGKKDGIIS